MSCWPDDLKSVISAKVLVRRLDSDVRLKGRFPDIVPARAKRAPDHVNPFHGDAMRRSIAVDVDVEVMFGRLLSRTERRGPAGQDIA